MTYDDFGVHLHHEYLAAPSLDEAFEHEAVTSKWFGNALLGQYSATAARRVDWVTDTIKCSLHTVTYTPDQDVHVHVFTDDSDAARIRLLFRDWLRHDASDRRLYEDTKRALARYGYVVKKNADGHWRVSGQMWPSSERTLR